MEDPRCSDVETSGCRGSLFCFSQRLYVCDDVLDLVGFHRVLERRHKLVAVLDPVLQRLVGNFIAVNAKGAALGYALQARTNLFLIASVVVAYGAFLLKDGFAPCYCRRIATRFFAGILCQDDTRTQKTAANQYKTNCSERTNHVSPILPFWSIYCRCSVSEFPLSPVKTDRLRFLHS